MGQCEIRMTVTFQHLVGSYENVDKTIAYNLENNWDQTKTSNVTPAFENGTDEPDFKAQFDAIGPNTILVNTIHRDLDVTDDEVNSDTVHSVYEEIVITIVAESRLMRISLEDEVNRILWELNVNSANRVNKSDGSNSHIDHFVKSEISFLEIDIDGIDSTNFQSSEGTLTVVYYKFRS